MWWLTETELPPPAAEADVVLHYMCFSNTPSSLAWGPLPPPRLPSAINLFSASRYISSWHWQCFRSGHRLKCCVTDVSQTSPTRRKYTVSLDDMKFIIMSSLWPKKVWNKTEVLQHDISKTGRGSPDFISHIYILLFPPADFIIKNKTTTFIQDSKHQNQNWSQTQKTFVS